ATRQRPCCLCLRHELVPCAPPRVLFREHQSAAAVAASLVARGRRAVLLALAGCARPGAPALAAQPGLARRSGRRRRVGHLDGAAIAARPGSVAAVLWDRPPRRCSTRRRRACLRLDALATPGSSETRSDRRAGSDRACRAGRARVSLLQPGRVRSVSLSGWL